MNSSDGSVSVALDAMGGDSAPEAVIGGADLVLSGEIPCNCKVHFSIYGKKDVVLPIIDKYKRVKENSIFIDVPGVVLASDKPSFALRHRRKTSMWNAIEDLKKGLVSCVVSAGNTGALMAISRYILGTMNSIDRPAVAGCMPSRDGKFVILDLGASIECGADILFQFAVMGAAYAKVVLGIQNPRVGLLNVGEEESKGTYVVQEASSLLKGATSTINFHGYVEPDDAFLGEVDVVVTDGFSGNVMLKTAEAAGRFTVHVFKEILKSSLICKIASCFISSALKKGMRSLNPKEYNGAVMLGLNGVVVKSHGDSDDITYAYAIKVAVDAARNNIISKIASEISAI
ncbi:phosphate acyltransferase PlsX [Anaplasma bovis]|uniref:phosphate acyltransferase PlsX n=1 Tax=Anaplasma bovis TaxID=186733 RepID=UPI002FF28223